MDDKIRTMYETVHEMKGPFDSVSSPEEQLAPKAPPAKEWPHKPTTLQLDTKASRLLFAYDVFLMIIPILLMFKVGLVIIAWSYDRDHIGTDIDHVTPLTHFVIELNGQMVTIFTIVFVTVVATLVKRHALFKAQQGAYISELEQFQGSVSLPSTLRLIWSLRAWNRKSIGLVVIWSFQYLGSQANKYEFRLTDSARFKTSTIAVRGPNTPSGFNPSTASHGSWDIGLINGDLITAVNVYSLSLRDGDHLGTDLYGMALLPDINRLLSQTTSNGSANVFTIDQDRHGWYDVSTQSRVAAFGAYTSAKGAPFYFETDNQGRYLGEYTYSPDYLNISCSAPVLYDFTDFPNGTLTNQSVSMNMTTTDSAAPKDAAGNVLRSFELWMRWTNTSGLYKTPGSAMLVCNITQIRVDFNVRCLSTGCLPKQMRWWNNTNQEASTSFKTPFNNDAFAANFFTNILLAGGRQESIDYPTSIGDTLCPHILLDILFGGNSSYVTNYTPDTWNSKPQYFVSFHTYFNLYFNTYYMISQDWMVMNPDMKAVMANGTDGNFESAQFNGALYRPHYAISWEWIAIDFVACLVLLYAAVASALFRNWTIAPDILGSVSSLTRDNPHLDLPDSGTTLSGMDRARMLKRVKVQLCDISAPGEGSGRIGLARVDTSRRQINGLKRTVTYA